MTNEIPAPTIRSTARSSRTGATYHVMAFRKLTRAELVETIRAYHAQPKVRKVRQPMNSTVTILTTIGFNE
jgi:hypothetical protein